MSKLVSKPDTLPRLFAELMMRQSTVYNQSCIARRKTVVRAEDYDELDMRLMATFPASDATATY